ncbi:NACHT domain-containing protein [Streptomyces sp. G45]|uniref:NACHT domain-containing protein n=1 Tax=Streptomyces sp. G45 TaxID=3406627 RepID=UPI003C18D944
MSNFVGGSTGLNAPGAVFHGPVTVGRGDGRAGERTEGLVLRVLQREFGGAAPVRLLDPSLGAEPRSVADVFVDLSAQRSEGPGRPGGASRPFLRDYLAAEGGPAPRTVLTGGPGQGKTTAARMLAQAHRAALLRAFEPERLSPRTTEEIARVARGLARLGIEPPAVARFPFWLDADAFAAYVSGAPEARRSVWHFLAQRYERLLKAEVSPAEVRAVAGHLRTVLLLDGYDEVSPRHRDAVLGQVVDFAEETQMDRADAAIVVTSRPQAYGDELLPHKFTAWSLTDLGPREADAHAAALVPDGPEGARLLDLFRRARDRADLPDILNTPLHVALVVSILADSGELPAGRHRLFVRYYDHVYAREEGRGGELGTFLERYRDLVDELHRRAAFRIVLTAETRREARGIGGDEFAALAGDVVRDVGVRDGDRSDEVVEQLIRFAKERLVLLVGIDSDVVGFQIKSLAEFLAAAYLSATKDEALVRERFRAVVGAEPWRDVARFMAAAAFEAEDLGGRDLRDSIVVALRELDDVDLAGAAAMERRGAHFAVHLLADLPELEERYRRLLLPSVEAIRDLRHGPDRLAAAAWELFDERRVEEVVRLMRPEGDGGRANAQLWRLLNQLAEAGNEAAGEAARRFLEEASAAQLPSLLVDAAMPAVMEPGQLGRYLRRADPYHLYIQSGVRQVDGLDPWTEAARRLVHLGPTQRGLDGLSLGGCWPLNGPVALRPSAWLRPLATPPVGAHAHWDTWRLVAETLDSPSRSVLTALARAFGALDYDFAWRVLPWPVLERVQGGPPSGPLDLRAWRAAEERWLTEGVACHDVDAYLRRGSLGSGVATSGFPFATTHWVLPGGPQPEIAALAEEVWSIWRAHHDRPDGRPAVIAERLLLPLSDYGLMEGVHTLSAERVRAALRAIPTGRELFLTFETAALALSDCPDDEQFTAFAERLAPAIWTTDDNEPSQTPVDGVLRRAHRLLPPATFRTLCRTVAERTDRPDTWEALKQCWIAPSTPEQDDWPLTGLLRGDGTPPSYRDIALALTHVDAWDLVHIVNDVPYWDEEFRAGLVERVIIQSGEGWLAASHPTRSPLPLDRLRLPA